MSLRRRLEALEGTAGDAGRSISQEALTRLSDEDLEALEDVLEARLASPGTGGSFEDLYAVATERSRRALDAFTRAVEAVRGEAGPGEEEPVTVGEEEARQRLEDLAKGVNAPGYRNGYRIWQYYRKR